jgi:hypothetical protein
MFPSVGRVGIGSASGGVCTGVMVSVRILDGPETAALCEAIVACSGSYEGFADRGLGSLPGGDESELVRGVRAYNDADCPGCDILLAAEKTEDAELAREESEPTPFSRSLRRCSWSSGESSVVL